VDGSAERGAQNVVERYLRVQPGEEVRLFTWRANEVAALITAAIKRAGGVVIRVPLEPLERETNKIYLRRYFDEALAGAPASILMASHGMPILFSVASTEAAEAARSRHLHAVNVDARVMGQSMRADPVKLAVINERLVEMLRASRVRVTSDAGTNLEVSLSSKLPITKSDGRPTQERWDNIPSGFVCAHPADISGTLVVDRSVAGPSVVVDAAGLRKNPLKVVFTAGRVENVECGDEKTRASVRAYLGSHPDAGRVGMIVMPTNYLVRSEIGLQIQDGLLPGLSVYLGYTNAATTKATYDAPVQLRLFGRRQTVEVRGQRIVHAGRFDATLVEGIDPFR
jgi:leucyl aminopeptidase (aminopeptidase T)